MSLAWDGSGHQYVACSVGTLGAAGTADYTLVSLIYTGNDGLYLGPLSLWSGSVTGVEERTMFADGGPWFGNGDFSAGFGTSPGGTWLLIAQSKAAGTNVYRWHEWTYASDGSGTKTHTNGTGTHGDGSTIAAVRLGDTVTRYMNVSSGIALSAVWKRVLSDADFVALCGNTAAAFMNLSTGAPDALWLCNVASPSSIVDSTGNGANATSVVGSGITGSAADPPSFDYSLSSPSGISAPWFKF
jgi:hypothetical protein